MAIPQEQIEQIKEQIISQIESTFPEEKKDQAIEQIKAMNEKELEEFLEKNNLMKNNESECIFCSILEGKVPSYKIGENENAIAVLNINPLSKGHTTIIPKEHKKEISEQIQEFSKKIGVLLKEKLSPKEISVKESNMFGHEIVDLVPIYEDNQELKAKKAKESELESLQELILQQEKIQEAPEEKPKEPEVITEKDMWLPRRIP